MITPRSRAWWLTALFVSNSPFIAQPDLTLSYLLTLKVSLTAVKILIQSIHGPNMAKVNFIVGVYRFRSNLILLLIIPTFVPYAKFQIGKHFTRTSFSTYKFIEKKSLVTNGV